MSLSTCQDHGEKVDLVGGEEGRDLSHKVRFSINKYSPKSQILKADVCLVMQSGSHYLGFTF